MMLLMGIVVAIVLGADRAVSLPVEIKPLVAAPSDPAQWPAWRAGLAQARRQARQRLNYRGDSYQRGEFAWVPSCYSCGFVMMCDERFYDPVARRYAIEQYLNEGQAQFGGYDAIVLWHAYPRIGFDARNQFDFYRDMPGGLPGLRELSRTLHGRGVKVFIDYNPWDTGTRREPKSDAEMLAEFVAALDADGIFLDTLHEGMQDLRGRLDAVRPGVVLESELTLPVERIADHHMSWAQWFADSDAPGVLWNKWFERRHMMHQIRRWDRDHTAELHLAWMNGSGMLVWENVFGTPVDWSPRDSLILRSMLPIQRRYVRLFAGEDWTPLTPTEQSSVYASLWQGEDLRLWTLVNRSDRQVEGTLLRVPHVEGEACFDLIAGREVTRKEAGEMLLDGRIGPRGIGAFIAGPRDSLGADFAGFLSHQAAIYRSADWSTVAPDVQEKLRPVTRTQRYNPHEIPERAGEKPSILRVAASRGPKRDVPRLGAPSEAWRWSSDRSKEPSPRPSALTLPPTRSREVGQHTSHTPSEGMVAIPAASVRMKTQYRNRECGFYQVPGQEPAAQPSRDLHKIVGFEREVRLTPYAIDVTPVTNAQYAEFLKQTGYKPAHSENFLKHWRNGQVPPGLEDHPVVYVDLDDARAYARWAGRRLATEEEWQYAAQGRDGLAYPWGNTWEDGRCNDGRTGGTTAVTAFPEGRSPFGCYDMCGNTWEWTESERSDGRTRFCILKGGSYFKAKGSDWYADGGVQRCDFAAKFLLMWPGLDRCATIGFRCAVDLAESDSPHMR